MNKSSKSSEVVGLSAASTDGDDFIELVPGPYKIDGGGGYDTVILKPDSNNNFFGLYSPDDFKNIEAIQGSSATERVEIDAVILRNLHLLDGGGGSDEVLLEDIIDGLAGNIFDLTQTRIVNAKLDLGYFPEAA